MAKTKIKGNIQITEESINNSQIAQNADISRNKLASGVPGRVIINDEEGKLSDSTILIDSLEAIDTKVAADAMKFSVIPTGAINGTNTTFGLPSDVYDSTHIMVFLNGQLLISPDDYELSSANTIELEDAPLSGDKLSVFLIDSDISAGGGNSGGPGGPGFQSFSVTTNDNTQTSLAEIEIEEDEMESFLALVTAKGPGNKHYWNHLQFSARRNASENAVIVGSVVQTIDSENSPAYQVLIDINGEDVRIRVTGEDAETVNWKCKLI
jgi:hypothetical protein